MEISLLKPTTPPATTAAQLRQSWQTRGLRVAGSVVAGCQLSHCRSEPAQAGGKVDSSDSHILLLHYHISWFKMKAEAPHSKSADFNSRLVKKWFGFDILVLPQKRNRLRF